MRIYVDIQRAIVKMHFMKNINWGHLSVKVSKNKKRTFKYWVDNLKRINLFCFW